MSPPWMPLYVADYLADTTHLSASEHGAYLLLIMNYWQKGSLPKDDAILARICRMSSREWSKSRDVLQALFGDGWTHHRIDSELEKARIKSEARAECGSRGGKAKALKDNDARLAIATILPDEDIAKAIASSSQPIEDLDKSKSLLCADAHDGPVPKKKKRVKAPPNEIDAKFEQFRSAYPTRAGDLGLKQAKEKLRGALSKGVSFDEILIAAQRYRRNVTDRGKDGTEFVKQMPAWFNAQPWLENSLTPANATPADATDWRQLLDVFCKTRTWQWGRLSPEPGAPGCKIPDEIIAEFSGRLPESPLAVPPINAPRLSLVHSHSERAA